jgi:hypothetical protein
MKIAIYTATRGNIKDTLLFKSVQPLVDNSTVFFFYNENNTEGLSKRYNEFIDKNEQLYDYIVFIHDDVYLDDLRVVEKLKRAHAAFDIVGLAGGINPAIREPALWHLMCGGINSGNLRGAVAHPCSKDQIMTTNFGPTPSRVTILDGLFISIDVKKIKLAKWRFNENFNFHHYDIASSIDANRKQLKLGVAPIWVMHSSPGLLNPKDNNFLSSQEKFISEYSSRS